MSKKLFTELSKESVSLIKTVGNTVEQDGIRKQLEQIVLESPYSDEINNAFSGLDEYKHIRSIGLKEAFVTRKALIKDIDLNLFVSCKQKTNYELMKNGSSPYASDDEESCIVIHHIGQGFDAPFAELTESEHSKFGNSKFLHNTKIDSWRDDTEKVNQFQNEKIKYWQKRANGEYYTYEVSKSNKHNISVQNTIQKDIILSVKEPLEKIFNECSISDLKYISGLVESYILTKELGANSLEDFALKINNNFGEFLTCPHCKSNDICSYGYQETSTQRKQRYKCKNCEKVFSMFNNSIISGSNFSFIQWIKFIDCLYNGFSLDKTAKLCEITSKSAADNRIKLFYALKILEQEVSLSGDIVIDETFLEASHKGNRGNGFDLMRAPHKRGHDKKENNSLKNKVCIVCALDENGKSVAHVSGYGPPKAEKIEAVLKDNIDIKETKAIFSDGSNAIKKFAELIGVPIHQATFTQKYKNKSDKVWKKHYIQQINSYHSRLKKFVRGFNGVSSELLSGYMYLFAWKERNRYEEPVAAYKELLSVLITPNLYKSSKQIIEEKIIESADDVEKTLVRTKLDKKTEKRYHDIYEMWGNGLVPMDKVGRKFGVSKQRISQIIQLYQRLGYAYTTKRDSIKKENNAMQRWQDKLAARNKAMFERNYDLLKQKESWIGTDADFYKEMGEKYNLKEQTIRNRICDAKRTISLAQQFKISDNYQYTTLEDIFTLIYERYLELERLNKFKKTEICDCLAKEFAYKRTMIMNIVGLMKNDAYCGINGKTKIPVSQAKNRDISIFIDYMKWSGSRKSFLNFINEKYGISESTTYKILKMNYMADPKRYDITKLY